MAKRSRSGAQRVAFRGASAVLPLALHASLCLHPHAVRAQSGDGSLGSSDQAVRNSSLTPGGQLVGAPPPMLPPPPPSPPKRVLRAPASAPPGSRSVVPPGALGPLPPGADDAIAPPVLPPVLPPPPTVSLRSESEPAVPKLQRRRRWNMVLAGSGILASTWAADRLLGNTLSNSPVSWVPLVGPWWIIKEQRTLAAPNGTTIALLSIDGLLQLGGLTLGVLGLILRTDRMVLTIPPSIDEYGPLPPAGGADGERRP